LTHTVETLLLTYLLTYLFKTHVNRKSYKYGLTDAGVLTYSLLKCCSGGTAPKIIEALSDRTAKAQKETTLQCKIDAGEPPASIHWYKDNKELYEGKRYHLTFTKDVATLRFADSVVNDSGTYRCEAVNKLGRVNTECKLTVECE